MTDAVRSVTSQEGSQSAPTEQGPTQVPQTTFSDLAASRAQRQAAVPVVGTTPDSGQTTPGGQEVGQRSEYIPRDRFDEVNSRRIAAEAQLAQLTQMTQAQAQRASQGNAGQFSQPQGQAVANSPQVRNFLETVSSKEEKEKWRNKILNQPVEGIAELVQYAIQTEGGALLQQHLAAIQSSLAPIQQSFQQQQLAQVGQYANQRAADPNSAWAQVQPVFNQLVQVATERGYTINPQSLQVIESVARTQVGLPAWGAPVPANAPFSERPSQGPSAPQQPQLQLTPEMKKIAALSGVDEATYARNYLAFRGGAQ